MQGHCDLTDDWSALVSLTAGAHSIYHSNLSDQSALEIGLGLGLDSESCTILAFFTENKENEHFIFREYHGR